MKVKTWQKEFKADIFTQDFEQVSSLALKAKIARKPKMAKKMLDKPRQFLEVKTWRGGI